MAYQIVVEFPTKGMADAFCGQMSDGFGENFCIFSAYKQKEGTDGTRDEHYTEETDEKGRHIFYVKAVLKP